MGKHRGLLRIPVLATALAATSLAMAGAVDAGTVGARAVSPHGSDANPCTLAAPCRSFDRVYRRAVPGQVVEVAAGTYPAQDIWLDPSKTSELDVVFRPRPASATVVVGGWLNVYGRHLEFQDMRFSPGWYVRSSAADVTFRNVETGIFSIGSARRVRVLGGEVGPWAATSSADPKIARSSSTDPTVPTDVLIDGTGFHDIVRPPGSGLHVECLQVGAADGLVIRNSTFENCAVHGLFVQSWGPGYELRNVLIANNTFGSLEGYHAVKINVPAGAEPCVRCRVTGNRASKPIAVNVERDGSSIRVAGNLLSSADLWDPGWCDHGLYGVVWDANVFQRAPSCGANALVLSGP